MVARVPKSVVAVRAVAEAFPNVVCPVTPNVPLRVVLPETLRAVVEAVVRVVCPVAERVPVTRFVVVAFVAVTPVKVARDAIRLEIKEFVEVLLVTILPVE